MADRLKVVPASEAGYGMGSGWIVRKWDPRIQAWFDVGDPLPTEAEARKRADAYPEGFEDARP